MGDGTDDWMDACVDGWMIGWMDESMDDWMEGYVGMDGYGMRG